MKKILLTLVVLCPTLIMAQSPWKTTLKSKTSDITLKMDLEEESIEVPGLEMFGPMNGYMNGNIYGIWMISSAKILDDKTAEIKFSNDQGSETQTTKFTWTTDSTATLELSGTTVIKRVVNKKLAKIETLINFERQ